MHQVGGWQQCKSGWCVSGRSIRLLLNPNQSDHFSAQANNMECGFRALFHHAADFPAQMENAILVPAGYHSDVHVEGQRVGWLLPP